MSRHLRLLLPALLLIPMALAAGRARAGEEPPAKPPPTREEIQALVDSMAEDDFSGKTASEKLTAIGEPAVPQLIEATRHRVPRVRYWSIAALSGIGVDPAVAPIVALLDDPNALVRSVAVWHLGRWFDRPDVREKVLARLKDKDASVRGWVLKLIEMKKPEGLVEQVRTIFDKDPDVLVRHDALIVLVRLQGAASIETLIGVLRDEKETAVRVCAVQACVLIEPRDPVTGDVLIRALRDKDREVRDTAAALLRKGFNQYFAFDPDAEPPQRNKAIHDWRNWYEANRARLRWDPEKRRFDLPGADGEKADENGKADQ